MKLHKPIIFKFFGEFSRKEIGDSDSETLSNFFPNSKRNYTEEEEFFLLGTLELLYGLFSILILILQLGFIVIVTCLTFFPFIIQRIKNITKLIKDKKYLEKNLPIAKEKIAREFEKVKEKRISKEKIWLASLVDSTNTIKLYDGPLNLKSICNAAWGNYISVVQHSSGDMHLLEDREIRFGLQCATRKRRSFTDLYRIVNTYLPNKYTFTEFFKEMIRWVEEEQKDKSIESPVGLTYCNTINKWVFTRNSRSYYLDSASRLEFFPSFLTLDKIFYCLDLKDTRIVPQPLTVEDIKKIL